jgi:hypothetical protein
VELLASRPSAEPEPPAKRRARHASLAAPQPSPACAAAPHAVQEAGGPMECGREGVMEELRARPRPSKIPRKSSTRGATHH